MAYSGKTVIVYKFQKSSIWNMIVKQLKKTITKYVHPQNMIHNNSLTVLKKDMNDETTENYWKSEMENNLETSENPGIRRKIAEY